MPILLDNKKYQKGPPRRQAGFIDIISAVVLAIILVGTATTTYLAQHGQDIRNYARSCPDGICEPPPPAPPDTQPAPPPDTQPPEPQPTSEPQPTRRTSYVPCAECPYGCDIYGECKEAPPSEQLPSPTEVPSQPTSEPQPTTPLSSSAINNCIKLCVNNGGGTPEECKAGCSSNNTRPTAPPANEIIIPPTSPPSSSGSNSCKLCLMNDTYDNCRPVCGGGPLPTTPPSYGGGIVQPTEITQVVMASPAQVPEITPVVFAEPTQTPSTNSCADPYDPGCGIVQSNPVYPTVIAQQQQAVDLIPTVPEPTLAPVSATLNIVPSVPVIQSSSIYGGGSTLTSNITINTTADNLEFPSTSDTTVEPADKYLVDPVSGTTFLNPKYYNVNISLPTQKDLSKFIYNTPVSAITGIQNGIIRSSQDAAYLAMNPNLQYTDPLAYGITSLDALTLGHVQDLNSMASNYVNTNIAANRAAAASGIDIPFYAPERFGAAAPLGLTTSFDVVTVGQLVKPIGSSVLTSYNNALAADANGMGLGNYDPLLSSYSDQYYQSIVEGAKTQYWRSQYISAAVAVERRTGAFIEEQIPSQYQASGLDLRSTYSFYDPSSYKITVPESQGMTVEQLQHQISSLGHEYLHHEYNLLGYRDTAQEVVQNELRAYTLETAQSYSPGSVANANSQIDAVHSALSPAITYLYPAQKYSNALMLLGYQPRAINKFLLNGDLILTDPARLLTSGSLR